VRREARARDDLGVHVRLRPRGSTPRETSGSPRRSLASNALHDEMVKRVPGNPMARQLAESWSTTPDGFSKVTHKHHSRNLRVLSRSTPRLRVRSGQSGNSSWRRPATRTALTPVSTPATRDLQHQRSREQLLSRGRHPREAPAPRAGGRSSMGTPEKKYRNIVNTGSAPSAMPRPGSRPRAAAAPMRMGAIPTSTDSSGQAAELRPERSGRRPLHRIQELIHEKAMFAPIWQLAAIGGVGPRVEESGLGLIRRLSLLRPLRRREAPR